MMDLAEHKTAGSESTAAIRVLMVEDDTDFCALVGTIFDGVQVPRFSVEYTGSLAEAKYLLKNQVVDVILLDPGLPDSTGLATFESVHELSPDVPIVVITGNAEEQQAMEAVKRGAQDYLFKGRMNPESLVRTVIYSLERVKAEQTRLRLTVIEDFIATLAHDLQVPMIGMDRALNAVLSEQLGELTPRQKCTLKAARASNSKVLSKIQRLLGVYRLQELADESSFQSVDVNGLLHERLECSRTAMHAAKVTLNSSLSKHLTVVEGKRELLSHVFDNLIDNAIRYGGNSIRVKSDVLDQAAVVTISDNGNGIPAESQPTLFKKFWTSTPGRNYVEKTGLGLFICFQIVKAHGGQITCHSSSTGTTMRIKLPVSNVKGSN